MERPALPADCSSISTKSAAGAIGHQARLYVSMYGQHQAAAIIWIAAAYFPPLMSYHVWLTTMPPP